MAVQIPDPGTGNGQTGDNEYVFRKKVKDNFTDQTNAASRLVGTANGNVAEFTNFGIANGGYMGNCPVAQGLTDIEKKPSGFYRINRPTEAIERFPEIDYWSSAIVVKESASDAEKNTKILYWKRELAETKVSDLYIGGVNYYGTRLQSAKIYTTLNTTRDSNGFLKAASPIVKVFADKVELNDDAVNQNVTYKKNGIGDYTITTVSGLSTDGWYIELPKDMNGNPKVAVTLSEVDGVISLKSYKRIFSMETFTFEPDLDNPLDIPDTRWIDLRLNEIPVEVEDDIQTEV